MEAVIVMRVHLLVYCLCTAVYAYGSPAVMCEPTSKMSTTAAAPLSIPVNSDVESIAIVQERIAVDFNTRQKKARSQLNPEKKNEINQQKKIKQRTVREELSAETKAAITGTNRVAMQHARNSQVFFPRVTNYISPILILYTRPHLSP